MTAAHICELVPRTGLSARVRVRTIVHRKGLLFHAVS